MAEKPTEYQLIHAFNFFDKDKSGSISFDELKAILCNKKGENPFKESECKAVMEKFDKDGNGVIDYNEVSSAHLNEQSAERMNLLITRLCCGQFVLAVSAGVNFVAMAPKAFAGKRSCPVCAFGWIDKVQLVV